MTSALLALFAALAWGTGDFLGGRVSKSVSSMVVVWAAAVITVTLTGFAALAMGVPERVWEGLAWGGAGGFAVALGALALYKGLATGRMSVVAPTAAVVGAGLPVLVDVVQGAAFTVNLQIGIGLALIAIWLLTMGGSGAGRGGLGLGVLAGLGFGLMFVLLALAPDSTGLWPVVGSKITSLATTSTLLIVTRTSVDVPRIHWLPIAALGVFDALATVAYLQATRAGLLSVAAVVASFYPAPTVALAAIVLHERLRPVHWVGAGLALGALALISL